MFRCPRNRVNFMPPRIVAFEEKEVCVRFKKLDTFAPSLVRQAELVGMLALCRVQTQGTNGPAEQAESYEIPVG
jgi:hypothetical protein